MPKAAPLISSFNAGEWSPSMQGRSDVKYYNNACRKIRNFKVRPQGPALRRSSTRHVYPIKDESKQTWLVRFVFNVEQSYILEFGDKYIRFFSNHGRVMNPADPANPLEVTTPYALTDLTRSDGTFAMRFRQSNDVLYIFHRSFRPRKLTRTAAAAFTLSEYDPKGGPFKDVDPDNAITVYIDNGAVGVGRTMTASAAIFEAGHVGGLFLLEQNNTDGIKQWEAGKAVNAGDVRRSDGKNYTALNTATTGTVKPVHAVGSKYDGDNGVQWRYDDPGFGWVKINSIGGAGTTAICEVLSRVPDEAVGAGNASTRWAFGAWSDKYGWPDVGTFFRERLCVGRDQEVWGSVAGDFDDMRARDEHGLVAVDMAFRARIESDRANRIEWMAQSDTALLVGTAGDEHAIFEITTSEPFGAGNAQAVHQSDYGAKHVDVERIGDGVLFVQKSGRELRDMRLSEAAVERKWDASDTTIFSDHVTKGGVIEIAYQQKPDSVLWGIKGDGQLLGFTLNREQDVRGWHPHRIGGYSNSAQDEFAVVESIATIPAPDGTYDELWMVVRRYINGATHRYIEYMEKDFETGDDPEDAFYVDSGLTLDNKVNATLTPGAGATVKDTTGVVFEAGANVFVAGDVNRFIHYRYSTINVAGKVLWKKARAKITAYTDAQHVVATIDSAWPNLTQIAANDWRMTATTITGLSHLEGQTVQVCADGAAHPDRVVSGGSITLVKGASKVHVGLGCTAVLQPMPVEAGAADGTGQGKTKRVSRCGIRFIDTLGARYGRDEDALLDDVQTRSGAMDTDEAPPLFTGVEVVSWPDGYSDEALLTIVQDQPLPCCVAALMPQINTQDNR